MIEDAARAMWNEIIEMVGPNRQFSILGPANPPTRPMPESPDHPLVSVIIPTKDRCSLLLETLASVQNQTYQYWEAVVVDDLSRDDTWPILLDLAAADSRIRPLRRVGARGGAQVARNQGFAAARGAFIVFLDSDDLMIPTALDRRVRMALALPEADAVVFQNENFADSPGQYTEASAYRIRFFNGVDPLDAFLASCAPWCTSGPLWRRAAVERVGPWDVGIRLLQDQEYHTRALLAGVRFQRFTEVDQYVRQHPGQRVSSGNNQHDTSRRLTLIDSVMELLRARDMLAGRPKRMLIWSVLFESLTYAFQRPRPAIKDALALWRATRERNLIGTRTYFAGANLILLQWLNVLGPLPREAVRLVVYSDLKRQPLFHPSLFGALGHHLKWMFRLYRKRIQSEKTARARSCPKAETSSAHS